MTLPAGTRLGSYEIVAPLGAGGMGERDVMMAEGIPGIGASLRKREP